MTTKVRTSARLDGFDEQAIKDMIGSNAFRVYRERIEQCLDVSRTDCEQRTEPREIHRAQGSAAALRIVLGLPDAILKEITGGRKLA